MDKSNGLYYDPISSTIDVLLSLFYQAKGKQALLESNLSGILLMDDKYFKSMGYQCDSPLKYLESFIPLKNSSQIIALSGLFLSINRLL